MGYYKVDKNILGKKYNIEIANRYYGQLYYAIEKSLLEFGFNVSSIGFKYWVVAIIGYRRNKYKYDNTIETVYRYVAQYFGTTRTRVERAMRTSRANANEKIHEYFNYNMRLTNKTVLSLLTSQFYIFSNENHIPHID